MTAHLNKRKCAVYDREATPFDTCRVHELVRGNVFRFTLLDPWYCVVKFDGGRLVYRQVFPYGHVNSGAATAGKFSKQLVYIKMINHEKVVLNTVGQTGQNLP